ncbi:MAG: hypothetical protein WBM78_28645, partial [Desulfobacterales bacterium]
MTGCEDGKEREQRTGPTRCLFLPATPLPSIPNRRIPTDFMGERHVTSAGMRRIIGKQIGSP